MKIDQHIANLFAMDENSWQHHANPWSVWTRYMTFPVIVFVIYSRQWIGYWFLLPLMLLCIWLWLNPRVFKKPDSLDSWASQAVLGEKVWLNRTKVPIPNHHKNMAIILSSLAALSTLPLFYGLYYLKILPTISGLLLENIFKTWFLDRMVWLYNDMKDS